MNSFTMKYTSIVIGILLSSVAGQSQVPKITSMYSLGDSVSDTGGYQELSGGSGLDKTLYPKGKFTDDKTWVEYLRDQLPVKKFKNYAVGRATTDSNLVSATIHNDQNKKVPGCIQQAENLKRDLEGQNTTKEQTLVTLAFFGNDFLSATPPSFEDYFGRISQCVKDVIETDKVGHIVMPTTSGAEYFPYFNDHPEMKGQIQQIGAGVKYSWSQLLVLLKSQYPDTIIHGLDHEKIIANLVDSNKNKNKPCINTTPFEKNDQFKVCENPASLVFYDQLHPSSTTHKAMADNAYQLLESESNSKPKTKTDSYNGEGTDNTRTPEVIKDKNTSKDDDETSSDKPLDGSPASSSDNSEKEPKELTEDDDGTTKKNPNERTENDDKSSDKNLSGSSDNFEKSPEELAKDDDALSSGSSDKGSSGSIDNSEKNPKETESRPRQEPSQIPDQNQTQIPSRGKPNPQNISDSFRRRPQNSYQPSNNNNRHYPNYHHGYIHHQRPSQIPRDAPRVYDPETGEYRPYYYDPNTQEHRVYQ